MKILRISLFTIGLASLASCGSGDGSGPSVTRPRLGGTEVDPPPGGFRVVAGQSIYVPAYSSIFTSDNSYRFNLSVTLSIRNADPEHPIIVTAVRYFDHDGKLINDYLKKPLRIGPMAAVEYFVSEKDTTGGVSASFLVEWISENPVVSPVVEDIMISTASSQGVAFTSPGRVVSDRSSPGPKPAPD